MNKLPIVTVILCFISAIMAITVMPDEGSQHKLTWMAYGATTRTWDTGSFAANRLIARKDLMRIAANIARFEPVFMIVDNEDDQAEAQDFLDQVLREHDGSVFTGGKQLPPVQRNNIKFMVHPLDDLWIRDTGAVFVMDQEHKSLSGVNFNFNGWGQADTGAQGWKKDAAKAENGIEDQDISNDRRIADFTIAQSNATKISTWLVMEGGGIEVDGKGTAVCTESCILNSNRNPGKTKADVEAELHRTLCVNKVIWLPGAKAKDITDGHVDFYARFSNNGHIIYTLDNDKYSPDYQTTSNNKKILQNATDALGNKLMPVALNTPDLSFVRSAVTKRNGWYRHSSKFDSDTFAASYIGYYVGDKYLLMAQYGDPKADLAAFNILKNIFSDKLIMQIPTDGISSGGGTIHCATQQLIALS